MGNTNKGNEKFETMNKWKNRTEFIFVKQTGGFDILPRNLSNFWMPYISFFTSQSYPNMKEKTMMIFSFETILTLIYPLQYFCC